MMKLIVLTGSSASGKTSLSSAVGHIMNIDVISKDELKIKLFEQYGFRSHEEKKILGMKDENIMYEYIKKYIDHKKSLIIDNNFKNFNNLRSTIEYESDNIDIRCIYCTADYNILAKRYNDRIIKGERHPALYTLNQYPIIDGISKFHKPLSTCDIEKLQKKVTEPVFGKYVLEINTNYISYEFKKLCYQIVEFINM